MKKNALLLLVLVFQTVCIISSDYDYGVPLDPSWGDFDQRVGSDYTFVQEYRRCRAGVSPITIFSFLKQDNEERLSRPVSRSVRASSSPDTLAGSSPVVGSSPVSPEGRFSVRPASILAGLQPYNSQEPQIVVRPLLRAPEYSPMVAPAEPLAVPQQPSRAPRLQQVAPESQVGAVHGDYTRALRSHSGSDSTADSVTEAAVGCCSQQ